MRQRTKAATSDKVFVGIYLAVFAAKWIGTVEAIE
jgi:hypothetical protein